MTRLNSVGKVIHCKLCKKFKFDHTNKWYKHNQESILENEMHKCLWDFEVQTDHQISARWPDQVMVNKKKKKKKKKKKGNLLNGRLCCPDRPQSKIKRR